MTRCVSEQENGGARPSDSCARRATIKNGSGYAGKSPPRVIAAGCYSLRHLPTNANIPPSTNSTSVEGSGTRMKLDKLVDRTVIVLAATS